MNQKQTAKPRRKIAKPDPAHLDPDTTPVMKSGMVQALGIRVTSLSPKKVVGEMKSLGVWIAPFKELDAQQQAWVREHYVRNIFPLVTPQAMDPGR